MIPASLFEVQGWGGKARSPVMGPFQKTGAGNHLLTYIGKLTSLLTISVESDIEIFLIIMQVVPWDAQGISSQIHVETLDKKLMICHHLRLPKMTGCVQPLKAFGKS